MRVVPFPVPGSASSGTVVFWNHIRVEITLKFCPQFSHSSTRKVLVCFLLQIDFDRKTHRRESLNKLTHRLLVHINSLFLILFVFDSQVEWSNLFLGQS